MKKLLAFLLSIGTLSTVVAQSCDDPKDSRNYNKRGYRYSNNSTYDLKQRDAQVRQINREYEKQVQEVRRSRRMSGSEKYSLISRLERQRDYQVKQVIDRYSTSANGRYDDRWANNNRRRN